MATQTMHQVKKDTPNLLHDILGYQARITHALTKRVYHERFSDLGVTNIQFGLLLIISAEPNCSQRVASEALGTPATVSVHAISKLMEQGLVDRQRDPIDRRNYKLSLTVAGEAVATEGLRRSRVTQKQMMAGLSDSEIEALFNALQIIQGNIRTLLQQTPTTDNKE